VREELAVAIETTMASGLGKNHGLCHGDLGNLDFLLEAGRTLGDEALVSRVYRMARGLLESMTERGYLYGMPGNLETPGLFVGLAGVGHGLLRLAAPERVPCLLAAAPPIVVEVPLSPSAGSVIHRAKETAP
jgi:lantibiotic modifying enzyme